MAASPLTVAVFGDVPYGVEQEAAFPKLIDAINRDLKARVSIHVGDINGGSTACTDERFAAIAAGFATLKDPLVYAPGTTLGRHTMQVDYQPELVENVRWVDSRVAFASLHGIGSDNGL